jgi:hypothetical protein
MKHESRESVYFDAGDVDLLAAAVALIPDLDITTYAAKLARQAIDYPIKDYEGLRPLFEDGKRASYKNREITFEQAEQFIPKEFFPIETESDLLRKLFMSFQRGSFAHALEAAHRNMLA